MRPDEFAKKINATDFDTDLLLKKKSQLSEKELESIQKEACRTIGILADFLLEDYYYHQAKGKEKDEEQAQKFALYYERKILHDRYKIKIFGEFREKTLYNILRKINLYATLGNFGGETEAFYLSLINVLHTGKGNIRLIKKVIGLTHAWADVISSIKEGNSLLTPDKLSELFASATQCESDLTFFEKKLPKVTEKAKIQALDVLCKLELDQLNKGHNSDLSCQISSSKPEQEKNVCQVGVEEERKELITVQEQPDRRNAILTSVGESANTPPRKNTRGTATKRYNDDTRFCEGQVRFQQKNSDRKRPRGKSCLTLKICTKSQKNNSDEDIILASIRSNDDSREELGMLQNMEDLYITSKSPKPLQDKSDLGSPQQSMKNKLDKKDLDECFVKHIVETDLVARAKLALEGEHKIRPSFFRTIQNLLLQNVQENVGKLINKP